MTDDEDVKGIKELDCVYDGLVYSPYPGRPDLIPGDYVKVYMVKQERR